MELKDKSVLNFHSEVMELPPPWDIESVDLDKASKIVTVRMSYPKDT